MSIEQPPLYNYKARAISFKVNKNDYFGAYSKLHRELAAAHVSATGTGSLSLDQSNVVKSQQSIIVLSEIHLDKPRQMLALEQLLEALEGMLPSIIVCAGRFISD